MRRHIISTFLLPALLVLGTSAAIHAAEPAAPADAAAAKQALPPERIDRDGKPIVGYDLMSESERAGYRSTLFFMKTLPERDAFRAQHLEAMKKRAKERGVKLD